MCIRVVYEGYKEVEFEIGFKEQGKFWCPERMNKINLGY